MIEYAILVYAPAMFVDLPTTMFGMNTPHFNELNKITVRGVEKFGLKVLPILAFIYASVWVVIGFAMYPVFRPIYWGLIGFLYVLCGLNNICVILTTKPLWEQV